MRHILVGVDGSEAAARALSWSSGLAVRIGTAQLVVATVYVADPSGPRGWAEAHELTRVRLERWCQPARDVGVTYHPVVLDGESGPALLAAATEHDIELTVVSRRGRGGFDALVAGSTADYLAHHTRRPLAIVPPEGSATPPVHLLVALDGSNGSAAAAILAAQLATGLQARVTAACILEPLASYLTTGQSAVIEQALSGHWVLPLREAGLTPECHALEGRHPADALIED